MRWLVLALTACNQVYGLDPTVAAGSDGDRDGVLDALDNCVAVANPDQADDDGDGQGDACDGCHACAPCAQAREHDEDGDRVDDGCDNCPARPNRLQENGDGDELGDACDASLAFERRVLFDGFGTLSDVWLESGSQWVIDDDAAAPTAAAGTDPTRTLEYGGLGIAAGTRWAIEIGVAPLPPDRKLGVFLNNAAWCFLDHRANGDWAVTASATPPKVFTASFTSTVVVRLTPTGPLGAQYVACEVVDAAQVADTLLEIPYPAIPKLVTTADEARYRYIEVIAE